MKFLKTLSGALMLTLVVASCAAAGSRPSGGFRSTSSFSSSRTVSAPRPSVPRITPRVAPKTVPYIAPAKPPVRTYQAAPRTVYRERIVERDSGSSGMGGFLGGMLIGNAISGSNNQPVIVQQPAAPQPQAVPQAAPAVVEEERTGLSGLGFLVVIALLGGVGGIFLLRRLTANA